MKKMISLRLDEKDLALLDKLADDTGHSRTGMIEQLIKGCVWACKSGYEAGSMESFNSTLRRQYEYNKMRSV